MACNLFNLNSEFLKLQQNLYLEFKQPENLEKQFGGRIRERLKYIVMDAVSSLRARSIGTEMFTFTVGLVKLEI